MDRPLAFFWDVVQAKFPELAGCQVGRWGGWLAWGCRQGRCLGCCQGRRLAASQPCCCMGSLASLQLAEPCCTSPGAVSC